MWLRVAKVLSLSTLLRGPLQFWRQKDSRIRQRVCPWSQKRKTYPGRTSGLVPKIKRVGYCHSSGSQNCFCSNSYFFLDCNHLLINMSYKFELPSRMVKSLWGLREYYGASSIIGQIRDAVQTYLDQKEQEIGTKIEDAGEAISRHREEERTESVK